MEGVHTPCQQGDSTQNVTRGLFGEVLGRESPPQEAEYNAMHWEEVGSPEAGLQPTARCLVFICMNKIQKRVFGIASPKVRGEITCLRVTSGTHGKVQPAGRFVKGERR